MLFELGDVLNPWAELIRATSMAKSNVEKQFSVPVLSVTLPQDQIAQEQARKAQAQEKKGSMMPYLLIGGGALLVVLLLRKLMAGRK